MHIVWHKKESKKDSNLDIRYGTVHNKHCHTVTYLGCVLEENLSGKTIALLLIKKINTRRLLYRKNRFLSQSLHRLLCNVIIQPHFDYVCSGLYPNLNKNLKKKTTNIPEQMYSLLFEFE